MKSPKQMSHEQIIYDGEWLFQWCCDCNLRHLWMFKITEDRKGKQCIIAYSTSDRFATRMRRLLKRKKLMKD